MDSVKRLLTHNWWLKLLSLAVAYALWSLVTQSPQVERQISAVVELRRVPSGLQLVGDIPGRVQVHLRGPETRVRALEPSEVAVILNLRDAEPGNHVFPLKPTDVEAPPGIEIMGVTPKSVRLSLAPRVPADAAAEK